jgi:hypothetical protein
MAQPRGTVRVVVELALAEAEVLARAAVVVTSALEYREINAADHGLLAFRTAVKAALSNRSGHAEVDQPEAAPQQPRRAS